MSRDKQTEIKQFAIDLQNASQKASKIITDETANYVKENHKYNNLVDYAKAHIKSRFEYEAEFLSELGYAKDSEVAEEIFAEIEKRGRKVQSSDFSGEFWSRGVLMSDLAELKKKFIGKDTNVTTKTEEGK